MSTVAADCLSSVAAAVGWLHCMQSMRIQPVVTSVAWSLCLCVSFSQP